MQLIASTRYRMPGEREKSDVTFFYNPADRFIYRQNGGGEPFREFSADFIKQHHTSFEADKLSSVMRQIIAFCNTL